MKKRNIYLDYNSNRRRRGSNWKIVLAVACVFLLAAGLGLTVYWLAGKMFAGEGVDEGANVAVTENSVQVPQVDNESKPELITAKNNLESGISAEIGPYGVWKGAKVQSEIEEDPQKTKIEDEWMGDFVDTRKRVTAKGIYVSAPYINEKSKELIDLLDRSQLNAIVLDVKDDKGRITYHMDLESAKKINATYPGISDMKNLIKTLKEHDVYLIARVVALKDPVLAEGRPELALRNKDGTVFRDNSGDAWVNPYKEDVWDYLEEVSIKCVEDGFDEINYDYIRFSTDSSMSEVDFGEAADELTRIEVITQGIKRLCETLKPMGVFVSCDVYGAIINSTVDAKIVGQSYRDMSKYLDYICPMIYPSHYGANYYNLDVPDLYPYELISFALEDSKKILSTIPEDENKAVVRPWLQDFTASWLPKHLNYTSKEVKEQIDAVYDSGYREWLLWNASIQYTEEAFQ